MKSKRLLSAIAVAVCALCGATSSAQAGSCPPLTPLDDGTGLPTPLILSEIAPANFIELYNNTGADISLGTQNFWLFSRPTSVDLRVFAPSVVVPAGGYATIPFPPGFVDSVNGGEIALYRDVTGPSSFFVGSLIVDFVCWGVNPHLSVKVIAESVGKWSGGCQSALTNGAISRLASTTGTTAADYSVTAPPSPLNCTPGGGATGACCAVDDTCSIQTEADCTGAGGSYFGDDSVCLGDSNDDGFDDLCVTPTGACCATDGTCSIQTETDCTGAGGSYFGDDSVCLGDSNDDGFDDLCVTPTGACCATDGTCSIQTETDCTGAGGSYFGDDSVCLGDSNADGFDDLCVTPTGACCATDNTCSTQTEADCLAAGGSYFGDDSVCLGDSNKDGFDDLCLPPPGTGACCAANDTCSIQTEADCTGAGGSYFGDGSACLGDSNKDGLDDLCAPPPSTEACCFADGSCQNLSIAACSAAGGASQGNLSICSTTVCPSEGCPGTGSCFEVNATPGCDDPACCTLVCELDQFCCDSFWDGLCVSRAENCLIQACCFLDGTCLDTTGFDCESMSGLPVGATTSCASTNCPIAPDPCPKLIPVDDETGLPTPMVLAEINPGDSIVLYNDTDADIDLGVENFWLCSPFTYVDLRVVASGTVVPAGGYATIAWPGVFIDQDSGGEVILYRDIGTLLDFGTGTFMVDFVCLGREPSRDPQGAGRIGRQVVRRLRRLADQWRHPAPPVHDRHHRRELRRHERAAAAQLRAAPPTSTATAVSK